MTEKSFSPALSTQANISDDELIDILQEQAFTLICQRYELRTQDKISHPCDQEQLFKQQSKQHQLAYQYAEAEWAILGQVKSTELSMTEKSRFLLEQKWASMLDHPKQMLTLCAVIFIALILPFGYVFQPVPNTIMVEQHSIKDKHIQHYHTGYGYQAEYTLSDGSVVKLNWNTDIAVNMTPNQRLITLTKGEANFNVAKDALRPFIVSVGSVKAQAIGTEFRVKKIADNHANIAVSEGVVTVSALSADQTAQQKTLTAKQIISSKNNTLGPINTSSLEEINAWRDGLIIFDKRPLYAALQEINRYTRYDIVINLKPTNDEVTATFFVDSANDALDSLVQLFDLHIQQQNNSMVISRQ